MFPAPSGDLRDELWQPLPQLLQHSHLQLPGSSHSQRSLLRSWGSREVGGGLGTPFGVQNLRLGFTEGLQWEQPDTSTGTDSSSHRKRGKLLRAGMFSTALADPLQFVHQSFPSPWSESSPGGSDGSIQDTALRAAPIEQVFRRYWGNQGCGSAAELTTA